MLVTLNDILHDARKNHYAVGLFNTVNPEMAKGVLRAAEEAHSPVIIGTAEVLLPYAGLEDLSYFLLPMAKKAKVPVALHFDHGLTEACIRQAISLGFSSIMYDCSTKSYDDNCRSVSDIVKYAHAHGVSVESELGHVGSNSGSAEGAGEDDHGIYTDPLQAKDFIERTGADALAVAIGTAHGPYTCKPQLDIWRLKEIADCISTPLVLHGGSGLSDEDFRSVVKNGIAKVNIFTDINQAQADAACSHYTKGCGFTDLMLPMVEAVKQATLTKIQLFGSVNRG